MAVAITRADLSARELRAAASKARNALRGGSSRIGRSAVQKEWVEPREVLLQMHAELKPRLEEGGVEVCSLRPLSPRAPRNG